MIKKYTTTISCKNNHKTPFVLSIKENNLDKILSAYKNNPKPDNLKFPFYCPFEDEIVEGTIPAPPREVVQKEILLYDLNMILSQYVGEKELIHLDRFCTVVQGNGDDRSEVNKKVVVRRTKPELPDKWMNAILKKDTETGFYKITEIEE